MANPEKLTHDEMFKVLPLEVMKVMIQSLAPSTTDVAIMMEKQLHKQVDSMVNMQHETIVRNAYEKQFPLNSKFGPSLISPQEKIKQEKQSHSSGFTKRFHNAIASVRKRLFVEDEVMSPYTPTHEEMFEQLPLNVMISMIQSLSLPTSTPDRAIKMEKELHILLKPLAKVKYEEAVRRAYGEQFHEDIKQEKQSHDTFATSLISPTKEVVDLSADSLSSDDELQAGTSPQQHTCTQIGNKKRRRNTTARVRKTTGLKVISHKETVDYLENNSSAFNVFHEEKTVSEKKSAKTFNAVYLIYTLLNYSNAPCNLSDVKAIPDMCSPQQFTPCIVIDYLKGCGIRMTKVKDDQSYQNILTRTYHNNTPIIIAYTVDRHRLENAEVPRTCYKLCMLLSKDGLLLPFNETGENIVLGSGFIRRDWKNDFKEYCNKYLNYKIAPIDRENGMDSNSLTRKLKFHAAWRILPPGWKKSSKTKS